MLWTEGDKLAAFCELCTTSRALQFNLAMSGLTFYVYNELATMTIKVTGPVTASVANTAKRVIVMVYMAAVTGKALTEEQKIGAADGPSLGPSLGPSTAAEDFGSVSGTISRRAAQGFDVQRPGACQHGVGLCKGVRGSAFVG
ncbi:hypothetical protein M885DRAFT_534097 [Pelagophyceae sp. CCMP2097]|nr:hypothetical protein M885DRAFT_534097 [Pelagophyceae sp. CCMP2097]